MSVMQEIGILNAAWDGDVDVLDFALKQQVPVDYVTTVRHYLF
jgi:hypothetical protein